MREKKHVAQNSQSQRKRSRARTPAQTLQRRMGRCTSSRQRIHTTRSTRHHRRHKQPNNSSRSKILQQRPTIPTNTRSNRPHRIRAPIRLRSMDRRALHQKRMVLPTSKTPQEQRQTLRSKLRRRTKQRTTIRRTYQANKLKRGI